MNGKIACTWSISLYASICGPVNSPSAVMVQPFQIEYHYANMESIFKYLPCFREYSWPVAELQ